MANRPWATWWRGATLPPPAAWKYAFEDFTGDDTAEEWALAAAVFIAQYRRRHGQGPTFRELFQHLLPETRGVPAPLPRDWDVMERRRAMGSFRGHVAIEWRRRGYIGFDREVTRSLRVGPRFRERSRSLHQRKAFSQRAVDETSSPRAGSARPSNQQRRSNAPLDRQAVISLLNITPAYLERLRKGGYLQAVAGDSFEEFPAWQFACRPELPVMPGIAYVSPVVPEEWTAAKVDDFMLTPHAALRIAGETLSPAQWLMRGDDPTRIVEILNSL